MGQVKEKVVLKYNIAVFGEWCVMTISPMQGQELSATCWDTGMSLTINICTCCYGDISAASRELHIPCLKKVGHWFFHDNFGINGLIFIIFPSLNS